MIKINPKIIIISIVSLLVIITILIFIYISSNDNNNQQETPVADIATTENKSSSTETKSQQDTTSEAISKQEDADIELPANYTEDMQPIDYAMGKLPIKNDDYFIYSTDGISFFVDINAYENTERGNEIKQAVNKWFTDQGLAIDDIGILYLYRGES